MLFVLTGSSCSGKTTLADALVVDRLAIHDSDERGVPSDADLVWRQGELERWVQLALDYETDGLDMLLVGQSPLGEVLAAPSGPHLGGIAVCLVDVDDRTRMTRLDRRDPGKWSQEVQGHFVSWARWHRNPAADPRFAPEVVRDSAWPSMRWDRWSSWNGDDPRWRTDLLDTTDRSVEECVADVAAWIDRVRTDSAWPLAHGWTTD